MKKITNLKRIINTRNIAHILFWSWNTIFLAFMFLGFAPQLLPEMLNAVQANEIPANFLIYALILTLIPALVIFIGFKFLRAEPSRLFTLGYGVEGPLMLLLAIRFFAVRQATPVITLLLTIAAIGMLTFLWQIMDKNIDQRPPLLTHIRLIGLTLLLVVGLYASLWLAFYVTPIGSIIGQITAEMIREIPNFFRNIAQINLQDVTLRELSIIPFAVSGFILLIYTGSLFVVMPIAVPILYLRAWWRSLRALATSYNQPRAVALTTAILIISVFLILQSNQQPQHQAFALLEEPPQTITEAEALMAEEKAIRAGLLNAYLAPQRYFSASGEVFHISELYEWEVGLEPAQANQIQSWYEAVAAPVLYQPVNPLEDITRDNRWDNRVFTEETQQAAELYEQYFDEPILEGEKKTIVSAARSTWSIDQARANWQAVDDREIYLTNQEITINEQGDWAEIELYEVYQNQTSQRQEVVYYFSLPESAVITGVWLNDSANREDRFTYQVAPRGAAQTVYRNEVRRNIDPALVEQIGPRQYRLRIFPIEPQTWQWDEALQRSKLSEGPPMHMWLTYRLPINEATWTLPKLAKKWNVYWDNKSERLVNGLKMDADEETWLPPSIPAQTAVSLQPHRVDFPNNQSVIAQPVTIDTLPQLTTNLNFAIILDRSRSMAEYDEAIQQTLTRLDELATNVDLYLTASPFRGEDPSRLPLADFDAQNIIYFGGQNAAELLLQFADLRTEDTYDAIFVLTDDSGYELGDSEQEIPTINAPVWMVHLNGDFPLGYDDQTLEVIQATGGGAAATIDEALIRLLTTYEGRWANAMPDILDGYLWLTLPTETAANLIPATDDNFAPLAARRLILAQMSAQRGQLNQVETLDALHQIAIDQSIVTPYSSMIVLVNRQQQRLLDELSQQADRFDREFEAIGETEGQIAPTVTGVPEPEEWLLIGLAVLMLGWYIYTNRTPQPHYNRLT